MPERSLCWIRRDLRLSDHAAMAAATAESERVAVVFVFDRVILDDLEDVDDRRVTFIHRSLEEVDRRLREHGSRLVVRVGDPVEEIPAVARALDVQAVYTNRDVEPYALRRDRAVEERLRAEGRAFRTFLDHLVLEPGSLRNANGEPFRVYTPFSKAWRARFRPDDVREHAPDPSRFWPASEIPDGLVHPWSMEDIGFVPNSLWLEPGEAAARERLRAFVEKMPAYGQLRDFVDREATSGLSVHLRHGTVSVRECVRTVMENPSPGADKWLSELIWREFYQSILADFPSVVDRPFLAEYEGLEWPGSDEAYEAWVEGRTGYPLVDAAMRCFAATGWMHNRNRMVVASFLTKDLLVDYRRGEAYFARKLLDFDLAQNNGGWQWASSVGCDPQPYFRIFNPVLQSRKFDPQGRFIRRWVPELAHLDDESIHFPGPLERDGYPPPIVDHDVMRERAIALLSSRRDPRRQTRP